MMEADQAEIDLMKKVSLEKKLINKLDNYHNRIVRKYVRQLKRNGQVINTEQFNTELSEILKNHYKNVADKFTGDLNNKLGIQLRLTTEELKIIDSVLDKYYVNQSIQQATIINDNTGNNLNESFERAVLSGNEEQEETGVFQSAEVLALVAGGIAKALVDARSSGIAMYETQQSAEKVKQTEAGVLGGNIITGGVTTAVPVNAQKVWVTVGDGNVRPAHVTANRQKVDIMDSFIVNGEKLEYPGDMLHGASIGNVINCRCSSVTDVSGISAIRVRKLQR